MNEYDNGTGNEQRLIFTILLCLGLFWVWTSFVSPPPPPVPNVPVAETAAASGSAPADPASQPASGVEPDFLELPTAGAESADPVVDPVAEGAVAEEPTGPVATHALPEQVVPFLSTDWVASWTTRGGGMRDLGLTAFKGPYTVVPIYTWLQEKFTKGNDSKWKPYVADEEPVQLLSEQALLLSAGLRSGSLGDGRLLDGDYELVSQDSSGATFQRIDARGVRITKRYELGPDPFQGRAVVSFENLGQETVTAALWLGVSDLAEGTASRYSNVSRPWAVVDGSLEKEDRIDKLVGSPVVKTGPVSWLGISSRYFLAALIPDDPGFGTATFAASDETHGGVYIISDEKTLAPGAPVEVGFKLYAGPMEVDRLEGVGHNLDKAVNFGVFGFFAKILLWLLHLLHGVVGNWGVAIIGLTLLVKIVFYPLTQKSFRSAKEMQRIQPLLTEMKEKYKDNKEMQTQETMRLFKEHGVNPMGGCLPTLIQLPVWFALYSVLLFAVDLYHSRFLVFLDLSEKDPFAVLPVVVGVLMFVQQRMTPMTGMDPTQAKMMRLMPLIFVFFIFSFPSGLALYICVNSVLTILQQWLINRSYRNSLATPG